jgi:ribosomal protein S18 acetylase RimI-like enzyme
MSATPDSIAMEHLEICYADLDDLDALVPLFDAYRTFYEKAPNIAGARDYLRERLALRESVILLARHSRQYVGFVQLYPGFSSIDMRRQWTLEDLFVAEGSRKTGVAHALMDAARHHAETTGAVRLVLATARTNHAAQALYESLGYVRDDEFLVYTLEAG